MLGPTDRTLAYANGRTRAFARACGSCGLLLAEGAEGAGGGKIWRDLARALAAPAFVPDPDAAYGLDVYTLRTAATRLGRGTAPEGGQRAAREAPHDHRAAQGRLFDLAGSGAGPAVALGVLCRPHALDGVLAGLAAHAPWAAEAVVLLDAPPAAETRRAVPGFPAGVRIAFRPLAGDFAAQRNALQDLAPAPWMLQLDADETLDAATGRLVPALAALAEATGAVSVGLPRENLVDGRLSDVFPDVQYRLNRRAVRYAGRVHERPDRDWRAGFIALAGAIVHHLTEAHVRARSRRYEALDPGRGRVTEARALLEPYRD
jgi:hypothetical protein